MLKEYSQFFISILFILDIIVVSLAWLSAYFTRFFVPIIPVYRGIPELLPYIKLLLPIWMIWGIVYKALGLYRAMRASSFFQEFLNIMKASFLSLIIFITLTYLFRENHYSRLVFIYFGVIHIIGITIVRASFRKVMKIVRKRGHNLRHIIIIGAGELGRELVKRINEHPEFGLKITGFLTRDIEKLGTLIENIPVIGRYEDIGSILEQGETDQVFIAIPFDAHERIEDILKLIGDTPVDIKVIPDLYQFATLKSSFEELDGLPIINLQDSPMYGWSLILKRLMDITISIIVLILLSPLMGVIAILIKLTSEGTVFYTQERMGLDGKIFRMLKFRSMVADAEENIGAVWAVKNDPRRTKVGSILRRLSMDEIPQFINVLKGDMSIVGPRPERSSLIEQFRKNVPKYMLRHKVKAGITGWAQINGWRGNTSIEKRIEHDIFYIENWSISFDFKIMLLTLLKGVINKNAY